MYFADLEADFCMVAEHRQRKAGAAKMQKQLEAGGWCAAVTEGRTTEVGVSGGTLVAWRSGYSARGLAMDLPAHLEGRVAAAELSMKADMKLTLFAIYGFTGERCGPNNLALLEWLGAEVQNTQTG